MVVEVVDELVVEELIVVAEVSQRWWEKMLTM